MNEIRSTRYLDEQAEQRSKDGRTLTKAKALEQKRINEGWIWVKTEKGRKLVKNTGE